MNMRIFIVISCVLTLINSNIINTNIYHMYKIIAFNEKERNDLYYWMMTDENTFFLNGISNEAGIPIMVAVRSNSENSTFQEFEEFLVESGLQFITKTTTHAELVPIYRPPEFFKNSKDEFTLYFHRLRQVEAWVDETVKIYSNYATKIFLSKTKYNHNIFILKLSKAKNKYSVFIMAGAEGSDWLASAVTLNIFSMLLYRDKTLAKLFHNYDFYFLPFMNPDGYEYTIFKDRFWKKNLRQQEVIKKKQCGSQILGVNLDMNWATDTHATANEYDCQVVQGGETPFSEIETRSLALFLNDIAPTLMAFIHLKSFSNVISIPYGEKHTFANNFDLQYELINGVNHKLSEVYNLTYITGHTGSLFINRTGTCVDWVKRELNVPLVYTVYQQPMGTIIPREMYIDPLSNRLTTILEEVLVVAGQLYGPSFSKQAIINPGKYLAILFITLVLSILN